MPFPLSEEELIKTESEIGAKLPTSYRNSMMLNNGGSVAIGEEEWDLFPIFDQSSKKMISRTCNHILKETKSAQEWPRYHELAIAIASNGCGDLLVIFQKGKELENEVFFWSHEDGSLQLVANDFSELQKA